MNVLTPFPMPTCHQCQTSFDIEEPVGRRDACPHCGADARCCLHCAFYEVHAADACREPNAEPVQHKDAANFCEFFALARSAARPAQPAASDTRARLDALFKPKS